MHSRMLKTLAPTMHTILRLFYRALLRRVTIHESKVDKEAEMGSSLSDREFPCVWRIRAFGGAHSQRGTQRCAILHDVPFIHTVRAS